MKMNYRRQSDQRSARNKKITLAVAAVLFIVAVCAVFPGVADTFSRAALSVFSPLLRGKEVFFQKIGSAGDLTSSRRELIAENRVLAERVELLSARERKYEDTARELSLLKNIFNRENEGARGVIAAVLSKPPVAPYDMLVVDAGEKDGVRTGDFVQTQDGSVAGRVGVVSLRSSRVTLFSSYGQEIEVLVGEERIASRAEGLGGGNFKIRLPRETEVIVGSPVFASAPSLKKIGLVESVRFDPSDSFKTVFFKSAQSVFSLRWVEIMTGEKPE
jgi:cell shape-determining protein MreC